MDDAKAGSRGARRPRPADAALLGGLAALAAIEPLVAAAAPSGAARGVAIAAALAVVAPLAVRRTRPLAASAAATLLYAGLVLAGALDPDLAVGAQLAVLAALAAVALHADSTRSVAAATALAVVAPSAATGLFADGMPALGDLAFGVAFVGGAVSLARLVRGGVLRRLGLLVELDQARAERAAGAAAAQHERVRVARDLHDVVGHHLVVASLHAGFAAAAGRERPAVDRALDVTRTALARAGAALAQLTGGPSGEASPAGSATLAEVVAQARDAGVAVDAPPPERLRELPDALTRTAARILQEGVTNAAKHAAGAAVQATLRVEPDAVAVAVRNGAGRPAALASSGLGLLGMEERLRLLGGELRAGPPPGGAGWELLARIPLDPEARRRGPLGRAVAQLGRVRGGAPAWAWLVALALAGWGVQEAAWQDDGPHAAARVAFALVGALAPVLAWRRPGPLALATLVALAGHAALTAVPLTSSPIVFDAALAAFALAGAMRTPAGGAAAVVLVVAWLQATTALLVDEVVFADLAFQPGLVLGAGIAGLLTRLRATEAVAIAEEVERARGDAEAARAAVIAAERARLRQELTRATRGGLDDLVRRVDAAARAPDAALPAALADVRERLTATLADLGRLAAVLRRS